MAVLYEKAFVGRIKSPKGDVIIHKKTDLLHAIIYEDPTESFDYLDLLKLVQDDNKLIFYTNYVNKDKSPASWSRCLTVLESRPPVGTVSVTEHSKPLTFAQFAILAYSESILTNSSAFDKLQARGPPFKEISTVLPPPKVSACSRSTPSKPDDSDVSAVMCGIKVAS